MLTGGFAGWHFQVKGEDSRTQRCRPGAAPPASRRSTCHQHPDCNTPATDSTESAAQKRWLILPIRLWNLEFFGTGDAVVAVTGNYALGGQVSTNLLLPASVQTNISFNSAWSGLQSVTFSAAASGSAIGYDNFVFSAVPIPAAVWLFASALAGLGWMRRRQAV